ncbi:MAG TPA: sugar phosphate isomerase/epimerase family protein [Armatimonadota bacterium]|nr:sugar phosphate isomerase/epimerase family protein [Armatimonadota bacterium]
MSALTIGVLIPLTETPEQEFAKVHDLGLTSCQLVSWKPNEVTRELAERNRAAADAAGVTISLFWCGYSGPEEWNYTRGPATIGLVPAEYRAMRTAELKRGAEIANWLGVQDMATHAGFLPLDPRDDNYQGTVTALKEIVTHAAQFGVTFNFETGQETPVVLLRTIQDIGLPNVGINLDPANLLMYGNGNPLDALDIFGKYVRGVHAKDGDYPTDGYELGKEYPLGNGRVDFPVLVKKLKALGYAGPLTIEREINGDQQIADIKHAISLLTPLL